MLVQLRQIFGKTQFRKTKACTNWRHLKREDVQLKTPQLSLDPLNAPLSFPSAERKKRLFGTVIYTMRGQVARRKGYL